MRHFDKINEILSSLDAGRPVVKIVLNGSSGLRFKEENWLPNVLGQSFHEILVNQYAKRKRIDFGDNKGYIIDYDNSIESIKSHVVGDFMSVVVESSPNKDPRRTSIYKNINSLIKDMKYGNAYNETLSLIFDIYEYYSTVTKEISLKNKANDIHRKNINHLINILEQKHGRKANGN